MSRPNTRSRAVASQPKPGGSREVSLNSHRPNYVIREEMERMMKEMQDGILARQHEMMDGFFQRMEQQGMTRSIGNMNQTLGNNAGAVGVGLEQDGVLPPCLEQPILGGNVGIGNRTQCRSFWS